jgi:hypothetical protein
VWPLWCILAARANALLDSLVVAGVRLRYYLHRACMVAIFILNYMELKILEEKL